ncbi:MAG: amidohydrolase [Clostridiales bacterium]|nr:amidohydrolase [Clostridiales bacterium]MCD8109827.1 amidohydrolase [Clostridiales bacterium]
MNIRFFNAKILTLKEDDEFEIIEGELWVSGNRILYVGDGRQPDQILASLNMPMIIWEREMDCGGNLLMPGFKNAHAHTYMTFLRSYADDLPLQEWLYEMCFPKEDQLTTENIRPLEILGIMEYLTGGITTSFDMCYFPPVYAQVAADCGFRAVQVSGVNSFGGRLEVVEENYHKVNETSDLTSFLIGFHAEYTTKPELMEGIAGLARKYRSPLYMHNSETAKEVKECIERYGKTPTQLTDAYGMYEYGGGGFHCIYFDDQDFEIFKKRGLTAVTCPASNLKLASGIAPLKRFYDAGINLAIGTDGAASNNSLDMFKEMFLASALAKVSEMDAACISADRILYMATTGGAKAMNLPDCDRLAAGKMADLILIDLKQPNMQPENNIVKNLVYSGSRQNVLLTMVDGRILYENQRFSIGVEPEDIYREVNEIIRGMK